VPDAVPQGDDAASYWQATRDRDDPSYDRKRRPDAAGGGAGLASETA
jgi:hypothetical protein